MATGVESNRTCCGCGTTEKEKTKITKKDERFLFCGGCKVDIYCSKECQKTAWKGHKTVCKELQNMKAIANESLVDAAHKRADANPAYAAFLQTPKGLAYMEDRKAKEALRRSAVQALDGDLSNRHIKQMLAADPEFARLFGKFANVEKVSDAEQMTFIEKFTQLMRKT